MAVATPPHPAAAPPAALPFAGPAPVSALHMALVLAGFCAVFVALFAPVTFRGNLLALQDGTHFFVPAYRTQEKLWDPWELSGFPVVGDPQEMSWYPPALLLSPWPGTWNAYVVLAYVLAAFLTFLFVRELTDTESGLVAGLTFALGGFAISNLSMINLVHAAAWLPGILLGLEKLRKAPGAGWVAWTGIAIACCLLAGHPQTAVYAGLAAIVFVAFAAPRSRTSARAYLGLAAGAVLLGLLLSAILVVPMIELAGQSARASLSPEMFQAFPFSPGLWTELFVPHGEAARGGSVEVAGYRALGPWMAYAGCLPLLLAGAAFPRGRRWPAICFAVVGLIALALAIAPSTPFGGDLHRAPLLNRFRAPVRHLLELSFALAVLAGLGAANLRRPGAVSRRARVAIVVGATGPFLLACRLVVAHDPAPGAGASALADPAIFLQGILWAASCAAFLLFGASAAIRRGALVLLLVDLGLHASFGSWRTRYASPGDFAIAPVLADVRARLAETGQRFAPAVRLHRNRATGPENRHRLWRVPGAHGYNPLCLDRYGELYGYDAWGRVKAAIDDPDRRALDVLAVRYVLAPEGWRHEIPALSHGENWRLLETTDGVRVYENRADPPRSWMVDEELVLSPAEILAALKTSRLPDGSVFDPWRVALLERAGSGAAGGERGSAGAAARDAGRVVAVARVVGPGAIDVELPATGPALLVLSDIWYPGWEATAAGRRLEIRRCDYVIMAVTPPPGERLVQFRFRPASFRAGAALSVLGLLAAGGLGIRRIRRTR